MPRPSTINTERFLLVALLSEEIAALIARDTERAGQLAGVRFPEGWPDDPDARDGLSWHLRAIQRDETQLPWRIRVIVDRQSRTVVGSVNLKGPPVRGDVEIGWGVVPQCRRRGCAFEAATAVIDWAARQPGVTSVSATVPDTNHPSQGLAAKLGMTRTGELRRGLPLWKLNLAQSP